MTHKHGLSLAYDVTFGHIPLSPKGIGNVNIKVDFSKNKLFGLTLFYQSTADLGCGVAYVFLKSEQLSKYMTTLHFFNLFIYSNSFTFLIYF